MSLVTRHLSAYETQSTPHFIKHTAIWVIFFSFFFFWPFCAACGFLVPCPGIKPVPLAVEEWLANHCVPLCAQWLSSIQLLRIHMNCSLPASPVYGIILAKILEWVAISSSRGASPLRDQTRFSCVSFIGRQILYH